MHMLQCMSPLVALSGRSADRVARSASSRKADMPNQRVKCPLVTQSGLPYGFTINTPGKLNVRRCILGSQIIGKLRLAHQPHSADC